MPERTAIYVDGLHVNFSGFSAITNLSLEIFYGQVRAIIGPNGAGKTTFLDVLTGKTRPTRGEVFLDKSTDLGRRDEAWIARRGISRKFQKPSVFDALSIAQNLELAIRRGRGYGAMLRSWLRADERERVAAVMRRIGLEAVPNELAGTLSHGQKQWLEIGMMLVADPKVLLLDEPVAGMSEHETERTAELIRSLQSPERAVVVIEHDMEFVERIADLVTVLHEGRILGEGSMQAIRRDPRVIQVYLGR